MAGGKSNKVKGLKIKLYIMSLCLLFLLLFLLKVDPSLFENEQFIGWSVVLKNNLLAVSSLLLFLCGIYFTGYIQRKATGTQNPTIRILEIKNENYEYLTFLTTYIIPLICIDFDNIRYVLVFFLLLILVGYIFIKMDLYYGNPTLALMGYRLYRVSTNYKEFPDNIILVSKDKLSKDSYIKWVRIDDNVLLAKELNK